MKTKSLLVAIAMLMLACQPKKEMETEVSTLDSSSSNISKSNSKRSPHSTIHSVKRQSNSSSNSSDLDENSISNENNNNTNCPTELKETNNNDMQPIKRVTLIYRDKVFVCFNLNLDFLFCFDFKLN